MEIDWRIAPEWADKHGLIGLCKQPVWFNSSRYVYVDGLEGGREFLFAVNGFQCGSVNSVTSRPATPSWSGEGLPPVGVVCEANFVGEWKRFEMRYYGEAYVVFKTAFEAQRARHDFDTCGVKFRPIRTPEQIAADEREAAIQEIAMITSTGNDDESIARILYDAGYRKEQK